MTSQPDIFGAPDVGGERDPLDRYFTPPWATRALLRIAWMEPCEDRYELFRDDPPTDYVVLPRVNYIGAPASNNQTSVWFVWERFRTETQVKHYPADIRNPTFDWSRL